VNRALPPARKPVDKWEPADEFDPIPYEKVVGLNNLLSISWLDRGIELARPVARLVMPGAVGTGFLLATDLLITNNHVISDTVTAEETAIEFNYQKTWEGQLEAVQRYQFDTKRFLTNHDLDYTIVGVAGNPGQLFGFVDVSSRAAPSVNDFVSIIQHPLGGPKQISFTDNKVSAVFGVRLQYATDTEPGSSGSPVFNQAWQLVGLHHAGGGLAGPDGKKFFTNEGIVISAIVRDAASFLGYSDTLYDLSFSDLRALLVQIVKTADTLADPSGFSANVLRNTPRLGDAFRDWLTLNVPVGGDTVLGLATAGVATGAALRQWARTEGHESIPAAAPSKPAPSPELCKLMEKFPGSETLPSEVYSEVLGGLENAPALVRPIEQEVGGDGGPIAMGAAFFVGIAVGASAYDPLRSGTGKKKAAKRPRKA
jgi:V8-like Glu-specific endopeptidase